MPATTKPRELPTLAEIAPRWADLTLKLLTLSRQEEELLAEAEALPPPRPVQAVPRPKAPPPPQRKPLSPAAKAALGGLEIPDPPAQEYQEPDPATESLLAFNDPQIQQAADLNVRLVGVREALEAIRGELPRALAEASRSYADAVRGQYSERASRLCAALVELASAYVAHQDFLAQVKSAGATTAFLAPLNLESTDLPRVMGDVRSGDSVVFTILARGAEGGHFGRRTEAIAALRKPAPPLAPAPFAEAVADLQAAQQSRLDARAGSAFVHRWNGRRMVQMRRSEAAKLDAQKARAAQAPVVPEPAPREGFAARVRASLARAGERWADDGEAEADSDQAA